MTGRGRPGGENGAGPAGDRVDDLSRQNRELEMRCARYEALLDNTSTQLAYLDPDLHFVWANSAYAQGCGHAVEELIGRNHFDLFPNAENQAIFERVRDTGQPVCYQAKPFEFVDQPERGVTYWDWTLTPVKDAGGQVQGLVLSLMDMTHRERAEEALRQSEEFNRGIIASSRDCIKILDMEGRLQFMSEGGQRLLKIQDVGRYLNVPYEEFWKGSDQEAVRAAISQAQAGGSGNFRGYSPTENGEAKWWDVVISPLKGAGGKVERLLAVSRDVTERHQWEETLRESEERLRVLFDVLPIGVSILGRNSQVLYSNPALEQILGLERDRLSRGEHVGRSYLCPDGTAMRAEEFPSAQARREQRTVRQEVGVVIEDGTVIWTDVSAAPISHEDWSVVTAVTDVTGPRQTQQALYQANHELELLVRELSTLLEISNTVALTLELRPLLELILDRLDGVVEYEAATIYRFEEGTLCALSHRGMIPQDEVPQLQFRINPASPAHQVIAGQEPIIIADVRDDSMLARAFRETAGERMETVLGKVRSWLGVPLTVKDRVVGLLALHASQPDHYTARQASLALAFANQAAVAIENARLTEQAQQLAALEERQRLARDLHDAVSQTLFSASLAAEVLPRLWERDRAAGERCLSEVYQLTRGALAEMRTLLLELRPAALIKSELADLLRQLAEAVSIRARVPVVVEATRPCPVPPEVQVALYRIAQEALNNVAKHAAASRATVRLGSTADDAQGLRVELSVADDGLGFDPDAAGEGHGLSIMRERAAAAGVMLRIDSQVGCGTVVSVKWCESDGIDQVATTD